MIHAPGIGEGCFVKVVLQSGKTFQGIAQLAEIRMRQPIIESSTFGLSMVDIPQRTWYMHFEGVRELTTILNDDSDLLVVGQDTWKEMVYWLERLSSITSSDLDGTEGLRDTNKQLQSFFSRLRQRGLMAYKEAL